MWGKNSHPLLCITLCECKMFVCRKRIANGYTEKYMTTRQTTVQLNLRKASDFPMCNAKKNKTKQKEKKRKQASKQTNKICYE